jgi:outer membrane lipoprotein
LKLPLKLALKLALKQTLALATALLAGCASDAGHCPTPHDEAGPSPAAVLATAPDHSRLGGHLTWGGVLIDSRHGADSTDLLIGYQPLGKNCLPRTTTGASGYFLLRFPGYLETADLAPGQALRASGRLAGIETDPITGQRLPVLTEPLLKLAPSQGQWQPIGPRPRIGISIGAGSGWSGGGIGISF